MSAVVIRLRAGLSTKYLLYAVSSLNNSQRKALYKTALALCDKPYKLNTTEAKFRASCVRFAFVLLVDARAA